MLQTGIRASETAYGFLNSRVVFPIFLCFEKLWFSRVGKSKGKETEKINAAYRTNNAVCNRRCEACGRWLAGGGNLMGGRRLVKCCQLASFMTELGGGAGAERAQPAAARRGGHRNI